MFDKKQNLTTENIDEIISKAKYDLKGLEDLGNQRIELMKELKETMLFEEIKKQFPKVKAFTCKKEFKPNGFTSKKYLIKFYKLNGNDNFSLYMSDYLFIKYLFTTDSKEMRMFYGKQGKLNKYNLDMCENIKIISIKEIPKEIKQSYLNTGSMI